MKKVISFPQAVPTESGDRVCQEADGCPTERAVLQRFWREHQDTGPEFRESVAKLVDDMLVAWVSNVPISQCSGISVRVNALLKDRAASAPREKT